MVVPSAIRGRVTDTRPLFSHGYEKYAWVFERMLWNASHSVDFIRVWGEHADRQAGLLSGFLPVPDVAPSAAQDAGRECSRTYWACPDQFRPVRTRSSGAGRRRSWALLMRPGRETTLRRHRYVGCGHDIESELVFDIFGRGNIKITVA